MGEFDGTEHAAIYAKYRPPPPEIIINKILNFLGEKISPPYDKKLDVGCGSGQSCQLWRPYFQQITGTDVSEAQIVEARKLNKFDNISYIICPAENIPLPDHSMQLIIAANSLHWFNIEEFFHEVKRLLVSNGVFAVHGYHGIKLKFETEEKTALAAEIMKKSIWDNLRPYWSPKVQLSEQEFSSVDFPFDNTIRHTNIRKEIMVTVDEIIGFVSSYSGYQTLKKEYPEKSDSMIKDFRKKLLDLTTGECILEMNHYLILCRD